MNLFFRKTSKVDYSSLTDGEFYVARYLEELGLEIETQKVLKGLPGDIKTHRRANLYLPACVEQPLGKNLLRSEQVAERTMLRILTSSANAYCRHQ